MRELDPDPFPYSFYVSYLNLPEVQAAIGAYQNFSEVRHLPSWDLLSYRLNTSSKSSDVVFNAFTGTGDDNREVGSVEGLKSLLVQGINVMLYAGDADYKWESPTAHALDIYQADNDIVATGLEAKL